MNNIYLVIYSKKLGRYFTKYFDTEHEKDKYRRRIPYITDYILIEDSSDINYGNIEEIEFDELCEHDNPDYYKNKYDSQI